MPMNLRIDLIAIAFIGLRLVFSSGRAQTLNDCDAICYCISSVWSVFETVAKQVRHFTSISCFMFLTQLWIRLFTVWPVH